MTTLQISAPSRTSHVQWSGGSRRNSREALHLTRKGWIVLVAIPTALLVVAAMLFAVGLRSEAQASTSAQGVTDTVNVNVAAGETLWALAAEYAPDRDPRTVVAEIVELNALSSSTVQAGQSLYIPVSAP